MVASPGGGGDARTDAPREPASFAVVFAELGEHFSGHADGTRSQIFLCSALTSSAHGYFHVRLRFGQPSGAGRHVVAAAELVPDRAPREGLGFFEQGQTCGQVAVGFGIADLLGGFEQCGSGGSKTSRSVRQIPTTVRSAHHCARCSIWIELCCLGRWPTRLSSSPVSLLVESRRGVLQAGNWLRKSTGVMAGTGERRKSSTLRVTMKSDPDVLATMATAASSKSVMASVRASSQAA